MNPGPNGRGKKTTVILLVIGSLILLGALFWANQSATLVSANFTDISLAESTYPNIVGSRIDTCALCHTSSIPVLNPFGAAYKAGGRGNASALTNLNNTDTDGDGFTNLEEFKALSFPGDPLDFPQAASPTPASPYPPPATSTGIPPTATQGAYPPPATPTGVPPTATKVGPTATVVSPTATKVGQTATVVPPTATKVQPTSAVTSTARPTLGLTATKQGDDDHKTRTPRVTRTPRPTKTPGVNPSRTPACIRDDDPRQPNQGGDDNHRQPNPCPKGFHPDDGRDGLERGPFFWGFFKGIAIPRVWRP